MGISERDSTDTERRDDDCGDPYVILETIVSASKDPKRALETRCGHSFPTCSGDPREERRTSLESRADTSLARSRCAALIKARGRGYRDADREGTLHGWLTEEPFSIPRGRAARPLTSRSTRWFRAGPRDWPGRLSAHRFSLLFRRTSGMGIRSRTGFLRIQRSSSLSTSWRLTDPSVFARRA